MTMTAERYIKAIIYLTVLAWTIILYLNHEAIKATWLPYLSTVTLLVLTAVMAFDLWLWKLPFLHTWLVWHLLVLFSFEVGERRSLRMQDGLFQCAEPHRTEERGIADILQHCAALHWASLQLNIWWRTGMSMNF